MKKLIIRADASSRIGTGHIMRCLALAQAWQDKGGEVVFFSSCASAALRQHLRTEGCDLVQIDHPHPHPDDLKYTLEYLSGSAHHTWVALDGYHFDAAYQQALKQAGACLLHIDDYGQAEHYSADLVLNQNISADETLYHSRAPYTRLLLGPRYALLRREFRSWRGWKRTIPEVARKVLVTMGGSDPDNVTLKVVEALKALNDPQLEIQIVAGPENPNLDILQGALLAGPGPMRLLKNVAEMPALMAWADIAISAGGSTCWEMAFMGLPTITIEVADNQHPIANILDRRGAVINLGWHESVTVGQLADTLAAALNDEDQRRSLAEVGRTLVDGEGVDRVRMLLEDSPLRLRPVYSEDCRQLWEWANDPSVRSVSFSSEPISWETHQKWFQAKLNDAGCFLWIAIDTRERPVGQIRFEVCAPGEAETHVSIEATQRHAGYGSLLIDLGAQAMFAQTRLRLLHAYIRCDNTASIRAFEKAGFRQQGKNTISGIESYQYVRKKRE